MRFLAEKKRKKKKKKRKEKKRKEKKKITRLISQATKSLSGGVGTVDVI